MFRYVVLNRIKIVILTAVVYFLADYLVRITGFLKFSSCVGLKSFMPATFGILFGAYGIIGQLIGCTVSSFLLSRATNLLYYEYFIIAIMGLGMWFSWHIGSITHKIHFRHMLNYIRFAILLLFFSAICGVLGQVFTNSNLFSEVVIWNTALGMFMGVPIMIIYSGLMLLNPILPPIMENGQLIKIIDNIKEVLTKDPQTFASFTEKLEELSMREKIDMKRTFEIQGLAEEMYLRIIELFPEAIIDVRANYDITFSLEYIFIGKRCNPFSIIKKEDEIGDAGFKLIKHRALLAQYSYIYGENNVRVVI
jgi:hypothetical protein